jgi:aminocarboxymuconate-semialdehyde decarboxylase
MTAVDAHAHVIVPELLRDVAPHERWRPSVRRERGRPVVEFAGRTINSFVGECVSLEGILEGRDRVVLSPWVPLLFYDVDPAEGLRRCRVQNEGLARMRARCPDRVSVLGAVPMQDPSSAAAELERLMRSGDFAGVEVTASIAGTYLGDPRFEPFWAAAANTGALVFVHPTTRGFEAPVFAEHYLWNLLGNPFETTIAAAHMVMSGTLERHPGVNVLLAHGGGAIVALRGRLRRGQDVIGDGAATPADALIRRFLFDTVCHDPDLVRVLVEAVGADRVLLGSDYPFDMGDPQPVQTVLAAGLSADDERAVLCGNAERVLAR